MHYCMYSDKDCYNEIYVLLQRQYTPLLLAAWQGHDNVADVLLKAGANIEARDHVS